MWTNHIAMLEDVMHGKKERRVGECVSLAGLKCSREFGIDDVHVGVKTVYRQACHQIPVQISACRRALSRMLARLQERFP
jgi:hypothetical protein